MSVFTNKEINRIVRQVKRDIRQWGNYPLAGYRLIVDDHSTRIEVGYFDTNKRVVSETSCTLELN